LFIILTGLFFIVTPGIILFSQGYLFDWQKFRLVQAGGIFVKTLPEEVSLAVKPESGTKEKKLASKKSLLGPAGTLIKSLLPQKYLVTVTPLDNQNISWQKELEVSPLTVTKASRIIFPKTNPEISAIAMTSSSINLVSLPEKNKKTVLYATEDNKIFSFENSTSSLIFDLKSLTGFPKAEKITELSLSSSGKNFIAFSKTSGVIHVKDKGTFLIASFFRIFLKNEKTSLSQTRLVWHPENDNVLFALNQKGGYFFDLNTQEYSKFTEKNILGLTNNYFLDSSGEINNFDYTDKTAEKKIFETGLKSGRYQISLIKDTDFLLKNESGELFLIFKNELKKISGNVSFFLLSFDGSRFVYGTESGEIFVYFLKDVFDDLAYKENEILELGRVENLKTGYLANHNWHLIAVSNSALAVFEIDKRLPINQYEIQLGPISKIIEFAEPEIRWLDQNQNLKSAKIFP